MPSPVCDFAAEVDELLRHLHAPAPVLTGTLVRAVGLTLEARGIIAPMGALCLVQPAGGGAALEAEVVGFSDETIYLMPLGEPAGMAPGARVALIKSQPDVGVGPALLGRVIDARGRPLDGRPPPLCESRLGLRGVPLNPMERGSIDTILDVGVRSINALLTIGRGQRMGLVAGSGVGKSVLLGMMTRGTDADVVVIGLIGERGREVADFIHESLGEEGLSRSVVVAAPADQAPVLRVKATLLTHVIAEYFRDQGLNVLMLVDSLTRMAHAQREIGLAIGEPPTAKGYPPSVFGMIPGLVERSGVGRHGQGSITAIYTILAEGDDAADPIVDIARGSLDGQVMLSRRLADAAHYPAIELTGSVSRVMPALVAPERLRQANRIRRYWTLYEQHTDLIQVGAYESGSNPDLDAAIELREEMARFLRQDMYERADLATSEQALEALAGSGAV